MSGPERIWVDDPDIFDGMGFWYDRPKSEGVKNPATPHIRADMHDEAVKALRQIADCDSDGIDEHSPQDIARAALAKIGEAG